MANKKVTTKKKTTKKTPKRKPQNRPLNKRQIAFCHEYISTRWNATQAAENAGYRGTRQTLSAVGEKLLRNTEIQKCIEMLTNKFLADTKKKAADVIRELQLIGFRDMNNFVSIDKSGKTKVKSLDEMGIHSRAINRLKITQKDLMSGKDSDSESMLIETDIDIGFESKIKELEVLAKHTGVIKDGSLAVEFPGGEFSNTKEIDLSGLTDEEIRTLIKLQEKAKSCSTKNG